LPPIFQRQLSEAPSFSQRPPLLPQPSQAAAMGNSAIGASQTALGSMDLGTPTSFSRPPSLPSNSRPPLGASAPVAQQASLQTPWGTAADIPAMPHRHARSSASVERAFVGEGFVAGMPSGGKARSVSMPCKGQARIPGDCGLPGGCGVDQRMGPGSSGSIASSNRRYASPLSHAGSRMLVL
jgi:hypothetical protein